MGQPEQTDGSPQSGGRYRSLPVPLSCSVAPGAEEILNQGCGLVSTAISFAVPVASPEQGTDGIVD